METKKVWLVIEKNVYGESQSFSVVKHHSDIKEAIRYKLCLEKLSDRDNQTYFLASDTDTVMDKVVSAHNKSVENGSYYKKQEPFYKQVKKEEEKKPSEEEMPF